MSQGTHDRAAELHNLAAHAHAAAAAAHVHAAAAAEQHRGDRMTAYELSKKAQELSKMAERHAEENFAASPEFRR